MSNLCPQCGAPVAPNAVKCEYCNAAIPQQRQPAPQPPAYGRPPAYGQPPAYGRPPYGQPPVYGGQPVHSQAMMHPERANWPIKNKVLAAILAILLGGIGVHKFYLGQTGKGVLYLLLCWTYIPALLALIEGITMLCSNDENFQIKYKCRLDSSGI